MTKYFITAYISGSYKIMIEADNEDHIEELFDDLELEFDSTNLSNLDVDRLDIVKASEVSENLKRGVKTWGSD